LTTEEAAMREVLAAERAWSEAHRQLDLVAIAHMMADDYVIVRPDGRVEGKTAALADYTQQQRSWDYAESDQLEVRVYGATAVVIGRWQARGINNGARFDYAARFISLYLQRNGRWQVVTDQSTEIREGRSTN
jgi:ketosteroid isomerase-like protein